MFLVKLIGNYMGINKLKTIMVFSNGSISFCYKTCNNSKPFNFLERDNKNFPLNTKSSGKAQHNKSSTSAYKNKYLITK